MSDVLTDTELVAAARAGDASCLGLLLERHRAGMRAVAVRLLGYGPAAEDAVQDAMLSALRRLDELRDPAAAGAWLRAIVRTASLMQRRSTRPTEPLDLGQPDPHTVEEELDRHALRDSVWNAIAQLPEPLQVAILLRHFGAERTYSEIAQICGVPIGTVRSRLHQARGRLLAALLTEASTRHGHADVLRRRRRDLLDAMLRASLDGTHGRLVAELAHPRMTMSGWWGSVADGRDLLIRILDLDASAGVRERIVDVCVTPQVTLMECQLMSPPWDPTHCPPAVLWLMRMRDERVEGVRLYHPVAT